MSTPTVANSSRVYKGVWPNSVMAGALCLNLVLDMQPARTELGERLDSARNVECPAPAGIGVHQHRQWTGVGNSANVDEHIIHAADPEIRDPQGIRGDTAACQIDRPEATGRSHT